MSLLYSLCSSSRGNCHYIGSRTQGVLLDAGIGLRNYSAQLALAGVNASAPRAIFVTHEHSDHVSGLAKIAARHHLPVYGTPGTLDALVQKGVLDYSLDLRILMPMESVRIGEQRVIAVPTPHDSAESCCYLVEQRDQNVMVCTDLGYVTEAVHDALCRCQTVLLESNYDENLMEAGSYPPFLKERIRSRRGHLSNTDCAEELQKLIEAGVKRFVLGHLSPENNRPELACQNALKALLQTGRTPGKDFTLWVAPRLNNGTVVSGWERSECIR